MRNIADVIEQFIISELFANDEDSINVKRSQLAEKLSCAPSQITYTLTTRFTPDKGFEVESKRGNGGFIRIVRLPQERTPKKLSLPPQIESAEGMVDALVDHRMITMREGRLLSYFLSFLGDHVTERSLTVAKSVTKYVCQKCGYASVKWLGKCPECGAWDSLVEEVDAPVDRHRPSYLKTAEHVAPKTLREVDKVKVNRIPTGITEFDRVLGGGIVPGSLILLGGAPGIGKSTITLDVSMKAANRGIPVLYVSGEESEAQTAMRAERLGTASDALKVMTATELGTILVEARKDAPKLLVIDSIQTMRCMDISSSSGTVSQVKESAARLLAVAKKQEIPMFIVGHVNKDGAIAGPKVMEHIVDTVLYFEGDKMLPYRILRAAKNRYGSTNELGMFDMTGTGLAEIENPSQMLLEGRPLGVSGNCVACTMEGSRPILSEIQALATKTNFPAPRRACSGYDYNRMNLLIAVLEKRAGYFFGNLDVYVNIVGGIALRDTACDLAVCLSMVSSLLDRPVSDKLIAIGEVGLGGEVRSVPNLEQRLHEAERIGFERAVIPKHSLAHLNAADYPGMKLVGAAYIADAINALKNDRL